jgi:excisionase family DNA binding protein
MDKLLLSPTEAAKAIGVSRSEMYRMLERGTLPYVLLGSHRKLRWEDLRAYVASLEVRHANEPTEGFRRAYAESLR